MKVIKAERSVDGRSQLYHVPGEYKQKASSRTAMIKGLHKALKTQSNPVARKKFKQDMVAMAKLYSGQKGMLTSEQQEKVFQI
jgi:hypothetical protein